ncbi:MAG TPA: tRNA (adenine-N1)-methyltransferase [Candidatus Binatia bacterium]|jgi:tRNA (adenine57-N1/adenine58-N1)-methyltransferase catalytic subunit|nr:tRNA (adenine-N1)-methyltransferase [Candidatus Binatia bacterium]
MSNCAILQAGDTVLFIDRKEREYLRMLKTGGRISLHGGLLQADQVIGLPEGSLVHTARNEPFRIFRPTYAHLIPNLPRKAQVIYPKDVGIMLLWGDVFPGASVVEVGAGPGALTIALLRAIGPTGTLMTIEAREDFCEMSRENVARFFGEASNWRLMLGDAYEGIEAHDADRLLIDIPEPWRVLPHAARALRPGGILVGYVPTVVQVKALVDELRAHAGFAAIEVMENLLRFWHVKDLSVRPEHRMVAHTGFIIVARRVPEAPVSQEDSFPSSS